jgi:1-deoxy-D-xylulose-5-phosphate reductoisomerase
MFQVIGLSAGRNIDLLLQQAAEFNPKVVSCQTPGLISEDMLPPGCRLVSPEDLSSHPDVNLVMAATSGNAGLMPILAAIEAHKNIALANKEPLVIAGDLVMKLAKQNSVAILPVDSEPSAIWQCMEGEDIDLSKVIITASGGPFRGREVNELVSVTPEEALRHPTWRMGSKITIDSATLMNKGFEVIEAHWLFGLPWDSIDVVIHPQSIVHAMVEFVDGSLKAQLNAPDMRLPIQYALLYPQRVENNLLSRLNLAEVGALTFEPVYPSKFPCFKLALDAGKSGGTYPAVLSAADEVAIDLFLRGIIGFTGIQDVVEDVLNRHISVPSPTIEEIISADSWARNAAHSNFQSGHN